MSVLLSHSEYGPCMGRPQLMVMWKWQRQKHQDKSLSVKTHFYQLSFPNFSMKISKISVSESFHVYQLSFRCLKKIDYNPKKGVQKDK